MTVIVWDGTTLAADRRSCYGSMTHEVTKIFTLPDGSLVGGSGEYAQVMAMLQWLKSGADPKDLPPRQTDKDGYACILLIRRDRSIWCYEQGPFPFKWDCRWAAIGSGREFARAALVCGRDAVGAVKVAIECSHDCGDGIDSLTLT